MGVKETHDRSIVVKESPDRGQRQKYKGKGGWIHSIWQLVDRFKYSERLSWSQRQWDAQTAAWLTHRGMVSVLLLINLCLELYMLRHSVWSEAVFETRSVLRHVFFFLIKPMVWWVCVFQLFLVFFSSMTHLHFLLSSFSWIIFPFQS